MFWAAKLKMEKSKFERFYCMSAKRDVKRRNIKKRLARRQLTNVKFIDSKNCNEDERLKNVAEENHSRKKKLERLQIN